MAWAAARMDAGLPLQYLLLTWLLLLLLLALSSGDAAALPGLIGGGVHEHCRRGRRIRVFELVSRLLQRTVRESLFSPPSFV